MSLPYMRERMADMLTMSDRNAGCDRSMEQMLDLGAAAQQRYP